MFLLVPAYPRSPGQKAVKRLCVCVCVCIIIFMLRFCFPGYSMAQKNHAVNHREPKTVEISLMLADLKKNLALSDPGSKFAIYEAGLQF